MLEHLEDAFADAGAERARVMRVGLPDRYVTHGKPALLREEVGLTGPAVAERVTAALGARDAVGRLDARPRLRSVIAVTLKAHIRSYPGVQHE